MSDSLQPYGLYATRLFCPPSDTIMSPALAGWFLTTNTTWEALLLHMLCKITITTNNLTCIDFQHFSQATGTQNTEIYVLGSLQFNSLLYPLA